MDEKSTDKGGNTDKGADGNQKKDPLDELGFETSAFEALERDFQEVLTELVGDKSLERFRVEYEKLHRALKKSHESEKRLIKRCRELNAEIVANAAKVQTALKLSQEDQKTIDSLKKEIEKAWKMVDASHEKEAHAKETIQKLKQEIANLSKLVEQGAGLSIGQEHSVKELLKIREELTKERDGQTLQVVTLRNEINELMEKVHQQDDDKLKTEHEIQTLKDQLANKKAESDKEQTRKKHLEKELKDLKVVLESRQGEIKNKQQFIAQGQERIQRLELQLKEQKALTEKALKDYELLNQRTLKLSQDLEDQINTNTQLLAENSQRQMELKLKEEQILELEANEQKVTRMKDQLTRKVKQMELQQKEVEESKEALKGEIASLEREIDSFKKFAEMDKKQFEDLQRERDILNKSLVKASSATQKTENLIKIQENAKRNLEQEIQGFKAEAQKQRKVIYQLEKEREKYVSEAAAATTEYQQALEEVKLREMNIMELQKKIVEGETKLKQQQNLYEAVRSDRNLYSKNLIEAQDEIAEMKRKFKIMNHQIEQLKEEINNKDRALVKEHFEHIKVEKLKDSYKNELQKIQGQVDIAEQTIGGQQAEIQKLNHIINEAEAERMRQKKEYGILLDYAFTVDIVVNERDILGTQLIRRNDELALLYEKIKIQQSTLIKGEAQYKERIEDIRVLKLKITDMKRELSILRKGVGHVDGLRNEVYRLQKDLLQEKTKVKALSEELENPMNIHRWRKLEGSDPTSYEMIQKIQTLQKRLIQKTEEVVEKDIQIQEKEKLYVELKSMLERQPGPEVAEQLSVYEHTLKEKTRQLKAMASELNMYQAQAAEFRGELDRQTQELQDTKKKYFEQKKKEQIMREKERQDRIERGENDTLSPMGARSPITSNHSTPRFVGGGFNVIAKTG